MAGQRLNITRNLTTFNGAGGTSSTWQEGQYAADVLGYPGARFDFVLKVYTITPAASGSAIFKLYTSMNNDDNNDTWILAGSFASVAASNTAKALSVTSSVLQYVKWKMEYTTMDLITFEILGVAW